jgi:hypothetical protein
MSKILAGWVALALLIGLALPISVNAAEPRADGIRARGTAVTDVSAYRRFYRRGVYFGRPYWRPRYAHWGPRYAYRNPYRYWRPRYAFYRPYWRPYSYWRPRPLITVGFGFGRRYWW